MTKKTLQLDNTGKCLATEVKPGVWRLSQVNAFGGQDHSMLLTKETIKWLAGEV